LDFSLFLKGFPGCFWGVPKGTGIWNFPTPLREKPNFLIWNPHPGLEKVKGKLFPGIGNPPKVYIGPGYQETYFLWTRFWVVGNLEKPWGFWRPGKGKGG